MADDGSKATIQFGADSTQLEAGVARAKKSLAELSAAAASTGQQASTGLGGIDEEMKRGGLSAKAYANALRQVGPQFTDIFTGLASGQKPLTVLIQQGGQLKDVFGGVAPAARALTGYIVGLINPLTLTAAAAAAVGYAFNESEKQTSAYSKALILSGNAAGATASQLQQMAAQVASATGSTQGAAADAVAQIAQTGDVAAANLQKVAAAAVIFERATGTAVKDTVAQFVELGRAPLEASQKLNEALHYLTLSEYERIKALDQAGKQTQAATVAQNAYADAVDVRGRDVLASLGLIERAWIKISGATKKAIEDLGKAIVGPQTLEEKLAAAKADLSTREQRGPLNSQTAGSFEKGNQSIRDYIALLTQQVYGEREASVSAKALADQVQARIKFDKDGAEFTSKAVKMEREIAKARNEGAAAGASQAEIEKRVADIREKFTDKGAIKTGLAIDRAKLQQDLAAYRAASEQFTNTSQNQQRVLDAQHAAGLIGDQEFYQRKRDLMVEADTVAEFYLQQEIARLQKSQATSTGEEAVKNQTRIIELQRSLVNLQGDSAARLDIAAIQQQQALQKVELSFLSATQAAREYFDALQLQQSRSLDFGQGNASRDFSAGLNQIADKYSGERRKIQNERESAIQIAGEKGLTDKQAAEFERRLALQDTFEAKSIASYQDWYAKREKDDQNAGLGAQEAVRNYLDEINKAGKATEQAVGSSLRSLEDELTNLLTGKGFNAKKLVDQIISEFLRLKVIKPIMNDALGGGGNNWLAGLFGTIASMASGSYDANYSHEGLNYPKAADGTNYVARTGLALIHEGEAVVPKKFNPAAGGSGAGGDITIHATYQIGSNVSRADVFEAVSAGNAQLKADLQRQRSRGTGVFR